jgi:hypothetical protein
MITDPMTMPVAKPNTPNSAAKVVAGDAPVLTDQRRRDILRQTVVIV